MPGTEALTVPRCPLLVRNLLLLHGVHLGGRDADHQYHQHQDLLTRGMLVQVLLDERTYDCAKTLGALCGYALYGPTCF